MPDAKNVYYLGQLLAALVQVGCIPEEEIYKLANKPLDQLVQKGLARSLAEGDHESVATAAARVTQIPPQLLPPNMGAFWLGYFHYREGNDLYALDPSEEKTERLHIRLTPRQKKWLTEHGGTAWLLQQIDTALLLSGR